MTMNAKLKHFSNLNLLYTLTSAVTMLFPVSPQKFSHSLLRANTESPSTLIVSYNPYLTILSLGDNLFTNGLEVTLTTNEGNETIEDYTLGDFDANNLG